MDKSFNVSLQVTYLTAISGYVFFYLFDFNFFYLEQKNGLVNLSTQKVVLLLSQGRRWENVTSKADEKTSYPNTVKNTYVKIPVYNFWQLQYWLTNSQKFKIHNTEAAASWKFNLCSFLRHYLDAPCGNY